MKNQKRPVRAFSVAAFVTFSALVSFAGKSSAQTIGESSEDPSRSIGVQISRQTTGSGHLNFNSLDAQVAFGRSEFGAGMVIHKYLKKVEGARLNYRFHPITYSEVITPFIQYEFIYRRNATLTPYLNGVLHDSPVPSDESGLEKYETTEHYGGFGARTNITDHLHLDLSIGLGIYNSKLTSDFDHRIDDPTRFREDLDASLSLKASLGFQLISNK